MLPMLPFLRWLLVVAALLCLLLAIDLLLVSPAGMTRNFDARSVMLLLLIGVDALGVFLLVKHVGHDHSRSSLTSLVALLLATATLHAGVIAWQVVALDRSLQHVQALHQLEILRRKADVLESDFSDAANRSPRHLRDGWKDLESTLASTTPRSARMIPLWPHLIEDATRAKHALEILPDNGPVPLMAKQRARQTVETLHEQVRDALDAAHEQQRDLALGGRHLCGALCATFALLLAGLHGFSRRVERWLEHAAPTAALGAGHEGEVVPLHAFFEASQHPYVLVDAHGIIQGVNDACHARYPALALGRSLVEQVDATDYETIQALVRRDMPFTTRSATLRDTDQRLHRVRLKFDDYPTLDGEALQVISIDERMEAPAPVCTLPRRHAAATARPRAAKPVQPARPALAPHVPFRHGWKTDVLGVNGQPVYAVSNKLVCTEPAHARFTARQFQGLPLVATRLPALTNANGSPPICDLSESRLAKPAFQRRQAVQTQEGKVVLFVENDENVRETLQSILQHQGHRVLTARDNLEAIDLASRNRVDLLVVDLAETDSSGQELLSQLRRTQPHLKVLYLTSFLNSSLQPIYRSPSGADFLQKPFSADAFLQKIHAM